MGKFKIKHFNLTLSEETHAKIKSQSEKNTQEKGRLVTMNEIIIDALNEHIMEDNYENI